jgi:hypothetical protein
MILADANGLRNIRGIAIFVVLLLVLLQAIRRTPKDRVLMFQTIAFGIALLIGFLGVLGSMPNWLFLFMAILFCFFVILAAYFGLLGRLRRRKRAAS